MQYHYNYKMEYIWGINMGDEYGEVTDEHFLIISKNLLFLIKVWVVGVGFGGFRCGRNSSNFSTRNYHP